MKTRQHFIHDVFAVLFALAFIVLSLEGCKEEEPPAEPEHIPVINVRLYETILELLVDDTATLTPIFTPPDATNQTVTWRSNKPDVATISPEGVLTGVGEGTAIITVRTEEGNKMATCSVTVTANDDPDS